MIDDATIKTVSRHGSFHVMGLCVCPCYDALMEVGRKIQTERELAAKIGSVSPVALAALMGADLTALPPDDES